MSSYIERLTRVAFNPVRNPKEERVTEAFAEVLRGAPDAARYLAGEGLLDRSAQSGELVVTTQRRALGLDRVDIELAFGPPHAPELLVWLELKWKARPDARQLHRYDDALRQRRTPYVLALVTPREAVVPPASLLPVACKTTTWQGVARALDSWRRAQQRIPTDLATWLVSDFLSYLEENNLASIEPLTITDALALSNYAKASARIRELVAMVDATLEGAWKLYNPNEGVDASWGPKRSPLALDFYRTYALTQHGEEPQLAGWSTASHWLEWRTTDDSILGGSGEELIFGAGITMHPEAAASLEETNATWLAGLRQKHFEFRPQRDWYYLARYRHPASIVGGRDLVEQAQDLSGWVDETFRYLLEHPPASTPN